MKSMYYKPISRLYYDVDAEQWKRGTFIAQGDFADGHLAYSLLDANGREVKGEETSYYQVRTSVGLVMYRI